MKVINIKDSEIGFQRKLIWILLIILIVMFFCYANAQRDTIEVLEDVIHDEKVERDREDEGSSYRRYLDSEEIGVGWGGGPEVQVDIPEPPKEPVKPVSRNQGGSTVSTFVDSYPGSRIDADYLGLLDKYCTTKTLKQVVAISVAESGMGRDLPHRGSNFWGWFKNGNRDYDPDRETMAQEICSGISRSYSNLTDRAISIYTGGDRTSNWARIYNWAMSQMN